MLATERTIGVHEKAKPDDTGVRFPGACWGREFVSDNHRPLPNSTSSEELRHKVLAVVKPWTADGLGCIVSVKLDMVQVRDGQWDSRLTDLAHALAGLRIKLIIDHEPEGDMTAAVFVAGNNRSYSVLKRAVPALEVATCAMTYKWKLGEPETAHPHVWAEAVADIFLADVYFGNSFPLSSVPKHKGWSRWYHEIVAGRDRRWGLAEYGLADLPDRAETIREHADWFADDPIGRTCETIIVWGTVGHEHDSRWLLDDSSRAAVAEMVARLSPRAGYRRPH